MVVKKCIYALVVPVSSNKNKPYLRQCLFLIFLIPLSIDMDVCFNQLLQSG